MSFRRIANTVDPVKPITRMFGAATDPDDAELGWYEVRGNTDQTALFAMMRGTCIDPVGLIEHDDRGLSQLHRWSPEQRAAGARRSFRAMIERHGPGSTTARLLAYNTWLIGFGTAPARAERVGEIGRALREGEFDIMALGEVFKKAHSEELREALGIDEHHTRRGPLGRFPEASGGLQTMVRDPLNIESDATWVYHTVGGSEDSLAQKGVLYTEIDLGPGKIDLFLTHMFAKGADEDGTGLSPVRELQAKELGHFIEEHRKAENVVIVVGDLNFDGRKNEYRKLLEILYKRTGGTIKISPGAQVPGNQPLSGIDVDVDFELRLHDIWLTRGSSYGATAAPGQGEDDPPQYERVCQVDGEGYCDDHETAGDPKTLGDREPGYRLDYIFVEDPSDDHSFNLDVTRVRRRPFWRGPGFPKDRFSHFVQVIPELPDPSSIPVFGSFLPDPNDVVELSGANTLVEIPHYMSDHIGLEVTLIASPKGP